MYKYDPSSSKAEEFINHQEILDTLEYAHQNSRNETLINEILAKADSQKRTDAPRGLCPLSLSAGRVKTERSMPWPNRSKRIFTAIGS